MQIFDGLPLGLIAGSTKRVVPPILAAYDFTTQSPGVGAMPSGLAYTRASTATVQTSASTVQTGLSNDAVPIANRGSGARLCFEAARTNQFGHSRDIGGATWSAKITNRTPDDAVSPDGQTLADRAQGHNVYMGNQLVSGANGPNTLSAWLKHPSSSGPYQMFLGAGAPANSAVIAGTLSTTWQRYSRSYTAGVTNYSYPLDSGNRSTISGGVGAFTLDTHIDLIQHEFASFPTSSIVTSGASAARSGARLRRTDPANVMHLGRLEVEFDLEPLGASGEYTADGTHVQLLYIDANNYARIVTASRVVEVCVGGVTYSSPALPTWTRSQRVRISVAMGAGAPRVAAVVGAGAYALIGAGSAQSALSTPAAFDLLCNGTTQQFSADVRAITFYSNGQSPASTAV